MFGVCTVFSGGPCSDLSLCKHRTVFKSSVAEAGLAKQEVIAGCGLEAGITGCVSGCAHGGEAPRGVCGWGIEPKVVVSECLSVEPSMSRCQFSGDSR